MGGAPSQRLCSPIDEEMAQKLGEDFLALFESASFVILPKTLEADSFPRFAASMAYFGLT
jgi:hypothetical protein